MFCSANGGRTLWMMWAGEMLLSSGMRWRLKHRRYAVKMHSIKHRFQWNKMRSHCTAAKFCPRYGMSVGSRNTRPEPILDLMAANASLSPRKKRDHSTRIPSVQGVVASIMHLVYCTAYFKCPTPPHREDIRVNDLSMFTYSTTIRPGSISASQLVCPVVRIARDLVMLLAATMSPLPFTITSRTSELRASQAKKITAEVNMTSSLGGSMDPLRERAWSSQTG